MNLQINFLVLPVSFLNDKSCTSSIERTKEGVKWCLSWLKVGRALLLEIPGSSWFDKGEKSTCTEAVEPALDFRRRNRDSVGVLAGSCSEVVRSSPSINKYNSWTLKLLSSKKHP